MIPRRTVPGGPRFLPWCLCSMQRAARCRTGWGAALERGQAQQSHIIDVAAPNLPRMNNYLLGGKDHYPADRRACEQLLRIVPQARDVAQAAHRFLLRATSHLVREHRIRQFLVFGAGLPTRIGVHQIAQSINARCRVVYADNDPLVLTHARALWEQPRRTLVLQAGPEQAPELLLDPAAGVVIDLALPLAVLFVSALQTIPAHAGPQEVLERTAGMLAPGSLVAASHLVSEDPDVQQEAGALLREAAGGRWGQVRSRDEVEPLFRSLRPVAPGLVEVSRWRPSGDRTAGGDRRWAEYGGVAMVQPGDVPEGAWLFS
ncbi:SAM-dependent methyltransferase [Streptomyces sp. NPDC048278]|uniref:SAM-dependent methyltransferase n=1 Tax=Streptomyces sp. NPDC048278 TaxID=3155809 RepID=UPI003445C09A